MLKQKLFCIACLFIFLACCSSPEYFHDPASRKRQMDLKKHRSGNILGNFGLVLTSLIISSTIDYDMGFSPEGKEFRKLKLLNTTKDTMFVNMLTDIYWDEKNYCDFMDIRIPPKRKCKILMPVDAVYNLYFSVTPGSDDEFIQFNTNELKKISLYPGLTIPGKNYNQNLN